METLVVVSLDNLTLRADSDDPSMPDMLLTVGLLQNDALERSRGDLSEIYTDLVCFGRAVYKVSADGIKHFPLDKVFG